VSGLVLPPHKTGESSHADEPQVLDVFIGHLLQFPSTRQRERFSKNYIRYRRNTLEWLLVDIARRFNECVPWRNESREWIHVNGLLGIKKLSAESLSAAISYRARKELFCALTFF